MQSILVKYSFREACRSQTFILYEKSCRNLDSREGYGKEIVFRMMMVLRPCENVFQLRCEFRSLPMSTFPSSRGQRSPPPLEYALLLP